MRRRKTKTCVHVPYATNLDDVGRTLVLPFVTVVDVGEYKKYNVRETRRKELKYRYKWQKGRDFREGPKQAEKSDGRLQKGGVADV